MDVLYVMSRNVGTLCLKLSDLPDFSTVCVRYQRLTTTICRVLLCLSMELQDTGSIQAIDPVAWIECSQPVLRHTDELQVSRDQDGRPHRLRAWGDLDMHCTMKQPQDSQVGTYPNEISTR